MRFKTQKHSCRTGSQNSGQEPPLVIARNLFEPMVVCKGHRPCSGTRRRHVLKVGCFRCFFGGLALVHGLPTGSNSSEIGFQLDLKKLGLAQAPDSRETVNYEVADTTTYSFREDCSSSVGSLVHMLFS